MSHAAYTLWEARIWIAINECTILVHKNSYRWFKSVSKHQNQSVHVILRCTSFSHHEAYSCWNICHISFICNSLCFLSLDQCSSLVKQQVRHLHSHMGEILLLARESKKQLILQHWLQKRETLLVKKRNYQWVNSWEDLKYNRLVLQDYRIIATGHFRQAQIHPMHWQ